MALIRLTPRVWYTPPVAAGDRPALGLAAGCKAALLIDGGNSPAHVGELLTAAERLPIPPLKALCLTHWHWDHTFGAAGTGLPVTACRATAEKLEWMRGLSWTDEAIARRVAEGTEMEFCRENILIEWPDNDRQIRIPAVARTFDREEIIDLGGLTARIFRVDSDHTPDCCVVQLVEEGVVFLGDSLYLNMDHQPWFRTADRTRRLMETLLDLNARWYVPAHHGVYSGEEFAAFARQMLLLARAAEGAETAGQAERRLSALTGHGITEEERNGLAEFLAAREHGPEEGKEVSSDGTGGI